ncbi:MAG: isochorismatase hydrolase [Acidobacteria bacterium]|nr:isochorismatase hydrolase [Acidobacteriota bacterium]
MKNLFFFDIDTQRDLMLRGGALYVPGAERLIPKLRRLFHFAKTHAITILSSAYAFSAEDMGSGKKPSHCMRGTEGQRKLDDTLLLHPLVLESGPVDRSFADLVRRHQQIILEKQDDDVFSNVSTEKLLRVLPNRAIVFGVPAESSVRHAALGLRRLGFKTAVIQDAILPLSPREGGAAEAAMRKAGVEFIALELLSGVQEAM